jgi:hypothetical protein
MKQLLACVLLLPSLSYPNPVTVDKELICDTPTNIIGPLTTTYGEFPIWIGQDTVSKYALLVNEETKSWTLIQFDESAACVLGAGNNSKTTKKEPKANVKL